MGISCNHNIPLRQKSKFYRITTRPVLLYVTECWASERRHPEKITVVEICLLCLIYSYTKRDKVRNEVILSKIGVSHRRECEKITNDGLVICAM